MNYAPLDFTMILYLLQPAFNGFAGNSRGGCQKRSGYNRFCTLTLTVFLTAAFLRGMHELRFLAAFEICTHCVREFYHRAFFLTALEI